MTQNLNGDCSEHIETLLPWFVNGQLDNDDKTLVSKHIESCMACSKLFAEERTLAATLQDTREHNLDYVIPSNWNAFQENLLSSNLDKSDSLEYQESDDISCPSSNIIRFPFFNRVKEKLSDPKTLGFIAMAQAAALVAVISIPNLKVAHDDTLQTDAEYNTLSSGDVGINQDANAIIKFQSDMTIDTLNNILKTHNSQLVMGPTSTDAYLIKIPESDKDSVLQILRSNQYIIVAEPISAE